MPKYFNLISSDYDRNHLIAALTISNSFKTKLLLSKKINEKVSHPIFLYLSQAHIFSSSVQNTKREFKSCFHYLFDIIQ